MLVQYSRSYNKKIILDAVIAGHRKLNEVLK